MNTTEWAANEILSRGMDYYNVALKALTDSTLRQTLGAELVDGALVGRDVELGEDVTVARGAVILGQTKILRGRVEQGAVVVDCVARVLEARSGSLLFLIEQLNEHQVESEQGQLLTDVIIMDEEIVRKVRVVLEVGAIPEEEVVLVNGKHGLLISTLLTWAVQSLGIARSGAFRFCWTKNQYDVTCWYGQSNSRN
jgi:hypothetical protein